MQQYWLIKQNILLSIYLFIFKMKETLIAQVNSASQVSGLLGMEQSLIVSPKYVFNIHKNRKDDLYFPHLLKTQRNTPYWYPIAATNL